jgi:hypothetical protein
MQRGPSRVGAIGILAHVEPLGVVPSLTWTGVMDMALPSLKIRPAFSATNCRGCRWKHASVSGSLAGQSL